MKLVSASSIIISSICLVLLPASASAQCAATREIEVPEKDSITTVPCVRNGPVVFFWETMGELDDDEYFITLEQNGVEIYSSGNSQIVGTASRSSGNPRKRRLRHSIPVRSGRQHFYHSFL